MYVYNIGFSCYNNFYGGIMKKQKNEIFNITKEERKDISGLKHTFAAIKGANYPKGLFAAIIIFAIISVGLGVIEALVAKELLMTVTVGGWDRLVKFAFLYFGIGVIRHILGYADSYCTTAFNAIVMRNLNLRAYNRLSDFKAECFINTDSSTIAGRIAESGQVCMIFLNTLSNISQLLINVAYTIVFAVSAPIIFVVISVFYITRAIIMKFVYPKYYAIKKKNIALGDKARNIKLETIRGALDIKGLNMQESFSGEYREKYTLTTDNSISIGLYLRNRRTPVNFFTITINNLVFMLLAAYFGKTGTLTSGIILFAWTYKGYVHALFAGLLDLRDHFTNVETSASRYMELFDEKRYPIEKFGDREVDVTGDIEFKNVTFYYEKNSPVLEDVSFKIEPNTITAFVGKTGCGKSTTLALIDKFYEAKKGKVYLSGKNIKTLSKNTIRSNISYLQQSPYIFNATFKENLLLVKPDATEEELIDVCKKSEIHDFILTTPKGYDTLLGENGINLSGGQKQRLAIARALLKPSKILMFDESTSSLDNDSQAKIQQTINNLSKNHTIIVVAHRLSTIINADKIIFMDNHKILAEGTHKQLMKNCKEYRELYSIESKNTENNEDK